MLAVQALSNTVWSFSKLGQVHNQLLDTIAADTRTKLSDFNAQDIANTVIPHHSPKYGNAHVAFLRDDHMQLLQPQGTRSMQDYFLWHM